MRTARRTFLAVLGTTAVLLTVTACRIVPDPLEDIGNLGGSFAVANAVNGHGVVAGLSQEPGIVSAVAMLWDPQTGAMTALGRLTAGGSSEATDVNDAGIAVGNGEVPSFTFPKQHAFVARPGQGLDDLNDELGAPFGGWHVSSAAALNNEGVVVGSAVRYFAIDIMVPVATLDFAYDVETGTITSLPITPSDINDQGLVAGTAPNGHAATYDLGTGSSHDLGTLGGATSRAEAVNDAGLVVGQAQTGGGLFHAFAWDPAVGSMVDLGTLGGAFSIANGVNEHGHVVGESSDGHGGQHPFFYDLPSHRMVDVGTLDGATLLPANDVNDLDVVVGFTRTSEARAWRSTVRFLPHT